VDVRSLAYRTDLMVRERSGSSVTDHGGHLVVRTPANPSFWWGNFILVPGPPGPGDATRWRALFSREFPDTDHCAIGVDGVDGEGGPVEELAALDLVARVSTVMRATSLAPPARPAPAEVVVRVLASDGDWQAAGELRVAVAREEGEDSAGHHDFLARQMASSRALCDGGHSWWLGAFEDGALRSSLGIVTDGRALARYQAVETHPEHRRRGLAGTLVHAAGEHAIAHAGVRTLVIVAEPDGPADGLYRSLGFADVERQVELNGRWMRGE
jgi:GNAT superfamily N-acetyltransferase